MPHPIDVEVCVDCATPAATTQQVTAAYHGGAARVELCSAMELDGLAPAAAAIAAARQAFGTRPGVIAMVRPHSRDFHFTPAEFHDMARQVHTAAEHGADGVVMCMLRPADRTVAEEELAPLVALARRLGLTTTFNRGYDSTPAPDDALEALVRCGVHRVLTCGKPWEQRATTTALDGLARIARTITLARGRIEVAVGGGVKPANVAAILAGLPASPTKVSLHAFSGARHNGQTTPASVAALVQAVQTARG